jgi:tetratricopeptide (TPR) repeat protein
VSELLIGALGALLSTNPPAALTNLVTERTGLILPAAATNNPVEQRLREIMAADDAAQDDVQKWLDGSDKPADPLTAPSATAVKAKVAQRFDQVKALYEGFLKEHPGHARGFLAYGSFLNDIGDEEAAIGQWEKSRELDPQNPAAWNNLANSYAHIGPVEKSFPCYEEALKLNPREPIYWHNYGTLTFLFRTDATNHFKTDEQGVFHKALDMYQEAIRLDPNNFKLLTDVAQTYYGVKPEPAESAEGRRAADLKLAHTALGAWTNAFALAPDEDDRQGVLLHMVRWHIRVGQWDDAKSRLAGVTNELHQTMKSRLERNLKERTSPKVPEK